jgi:hypothetical protein
MFDLSHDLNEPLLFSTIFLLLLPRLSLAITLAQTNFNEVQVLAERSLILSPLELHNFITQRQKIMIYNDVEIFHRSLKFQNNC